MRDPHAPATDRQVTYLAGLAVLASPAPARLLLQLLAPLDGIVLDEDETVAGHLTRARASELIDVLKHRKEHRV